MVRSFYPWVENPSEEGKGAEEAAAAEATGDFEEVGEVGVLGEVVTHEARIAVVDDPSAAPRVSIVDPAPIREYVEAITQATYSYAREQGGSIPFMVIREVVENLIHAYFTDPVVTILPGGDTIRFSDRGPGIPSKEQALEYGTTTATEAMKRYIRGVGSGLPYVLHFLEEKGGSLTIEDNLTSGTVVTMSLDPLVSRETPPAIETFPQVETPNVADANQGAVPSPSDLTLTTADRQVLAYLQGHPNVGPKDLAGSYGTSISTWSRRLSDLESKGVLEKRGQKRYLTSLGQRLVSLVAGS